MVELRQNYDPRLIDRIKTLPQRRYDPNGKRWFVPLHLDALETTLAFALEWGYDVPADVQQAMDRVLRDYTAKLSLSHAADSAFEIEGLGGTLFPFQRAGVQYAAQARDVLIADEMGLGKTVQALAAIKLGGDFPAIIVCPASIKRNWERETRKWLPGIKVAVLGGGLMPLTKFNGSSVYDVVIVNYNSKILAKWLDQLKAIKPACVVLDEAHHCKNPKAQQTKLVDQLLSQIEPTPRRIFLTGTPVVNRPMEFWT